MVFTVFPHFQVAIRRAWKFHLQNALELWSAGLVVAGHSAQIAGEQTSSMFQTGSTGAPQAHLPRMASLRAIAAPAHMDKVCS